MMPILLFVAAGASIAQTVLMRQQRHEFSFWLVSLTAAAMTAVLGMTLAINVPLNNALMTWSVASPPANLAEMWQPWETSHAIRTVVAIVAFLLQCASLGGPPSARSVSAPTAT